MRKQRRYTKRKFYKVRFKSDFYYKYISAYGWNEARAIALIYRGKII